MPTVNLFSALQKIVSASSNYQFIKFAKGIVEAGKAIEPYVLEQDCSEHRTSEGAHTFLQREAAIKKLLVGLFEPAEPKENTSGIEGIRLPASWINNDPILSSEWEQGKDNPSEFVKRNMEKILTSLFDIQENKARGFNGTALEIIYFDEKNQKHVIKFEINQRAGPQLEISIDGGSYDDLSWGLGIQSQEYQDIGIIYSKLCDLIELKKQFIASEEQTQLYTSLPES